MDHGDFSNVPRALWTLQSAADTASREQAQSYLLAVQHSPHLSWPHISSWLASTDTAVQVFGAQSMHTRMLRGWSQMEGEEREAWKECAVGLLDGICREELPVSQAARQKLLQTIVVVMLNGFPVHWPRPIEDLLDRLHSHLSNPPVLSSLLEVLSLLPEESERFPFTPDQRYKWMHELKGSFDSVASCLSQIPLRELAGGKLACLAAWIKAGIPLQKIEAEINEALGLLLVSRETYFEPVIDLLVEVASLLTLDRSQSLSLIPILLGLRIQDREDEEEVRQVVRLYVAYTEAHCDDLFNALIEGSQEAFQFLNTYLSFTGWPGTYLIDETVSESTLNAWCLIHDLAIDAGLPADSLVASLFIELARTLLRKSMLSSDEEWASLPRDKRAEFEQYRRDLSDALLYCWRILRTDLLPILSNGLISPGGLSWQLIESRLHAFIAVSEEIDEPHELIVTLLESLPSLVEHPRNRCHAIRLFGCFAHMKVIPEGTIELLIGEVSTATNNTTTDSAVEAARALHLINEDAPDLLINHLPSLINLLTLPLQDKIMTLVCKTVGSLASETGKNPLEHLSEAIGILLTRREQQQHSLTHISVLLRATNFKDKVSNVDLLTCAAFLRLVDIVKNGLAIPEDKSASIEMMETLVITGGEAAFQLVSPLIETIARSPMDSQMIILCTTVLCIYGPNRPDLISYLMTPILHTQPSALEIDADEWYESLLEMIGKVSAKCMGGLARLPINDPISWASHRLASASLSTPLLRSIIKCHVTLLSCTFDSHAHWLESLYSAHGPGLLQASLHSACNLMPRSQVESVGRLLFELLQRFPGPGRVWLHQALAVEGFPATRYSLQEKEAFGRAMMACRSVGKAKQIFTDFVTKE